MMYKKPNNSWRRRMVRVNPSTGSRPPFVLVLTAWCLLVSCLTAIPAMAQIPGIPGETESKEVTWSAPDLTNLPSNWWTQLEAGSPGDAVQRVDQFLAALKQRSSGLGGDELITAQSGIAHLKSQFELLALARSGPANQHFEPPLARETYTLDDVLSLRAQWRELALQEAQVRLRIEQTERKTRLLKGSRDKLLREYGSADPESPLRILKGIRGISARVEYELELVRTNNARKTIKQIQAQSVLLNEQQVFARDHLVNTDATLADLKRGVSEAGVKVTKMTEKVAATQPQLLEVLSADTVNMSLETLRKQQLTQTLAEAELAELQELVAISRSNWYHFRAGELDSRFNIQSETAQSRRMAADSLKQAELGSSISQATLITPSSDTSPNTIKNIAIAQSVARDTLAIIDQLKSTSDDLFLIQDIFTTEFISAQVGFGSRAARLVFTMGNAWDRMLELADFHLFSIGETPVTPAGLVKMLLIMGMALGISWLIRFLLARGIRKKRAAQSPAFYALGRILHYIIVMAGSFAALGSIGIDFTSFALIAGALSVGIGFGLQAIVSNFVSGLILLFEGTLRVGDYIELDSGLCGVVKEINTRATIINTNDSVDVVVPNSELVTTKLTNWTLRETVARVRVPFGVAYGSDKELVRKLALEASEKVEFALMKMPGREPQVRLTNFGDSALEFDALIWVSRQGVRRPGRIQGSFLWALETLFRENGIEIPFPQRDVHLRSDFRGAEDESPEPDLPQA